MNSETCTKFIVSNKSLNDKHFDVLFSINSALHLQIFSSIDKYLLSYSLQSKQLFINGPLHVLQFWWQTIINMNFTWIFNQFKLIIVNELEIKNFCNQEGWVIIITSYNNIE